MKEIIKGANEMFIDFLRTALMSCILIILIFGPLILVGYLVIKKSQWYAILIIPVLYLLFLFISIVYNLRKWKQKQYGT